MHINVNEPVIHLYVDSFVCTSSLQWIKSRILLSVLFTSHKNKAINKYVNICIYIYIISKRQTQRQKKKKKKKVINVYKQIAILNVNHN